jgi:hypothetical protein
VCFLFPLATKLVHIVHFLHGLIGDAATRSSNVVGTIRKWHANCEGWGTIQSKTILAGGQTKDGVPRAHDHRPTYSQNCIATSGSCMNSSHNTSSESESYSGYEEFLASRQQVPVTSQEETIVKGSGWVDEMWCEAHLTGDVFVMWSAFASWPEHVIWWTCVNSHHGNCFASLMKWVISHCWLVVFGRNRLLNFT